MPNETEVIIPIHQRLEDAPMRARVCLFFAATVFFGVGLFIHYVLIGDKTIPKEFKQFVEEEPNRYYPSHILFLIFAATLIENGIYGLIHHLRQSDFALNWAFFVPLPCLILSLYSVWMEHKDNTILEEYYTPKLLNSQQFYYKHATEEEFKYVAAWDNIQRSLKCCGTLNFTEWNVVPGAPIFRGFVPESCCRNGSDCSQYVELIDTLPWHWKDVEQYIYVNGCVKTSFEFSNTQIWVLSFILPVSIMLLGVYLAIFLYKMFYLIFPDFRLELIESDGTRETRVWRTSRYGSFDDHNDEYMYPETVTLRHYKVKGLCFECSCWR